MISRAMLWSIVSMLCTVGTLPIYAQGLGELKNALSAVEKADLKLTADPMAVEPELTEIRKIGVANTFHGAKDLYFVRFVGQNAQGGAQSFVQVIYIDKNGTLDFSHSIGCGCEDAQLKGDRSQILMLGNRQYDLSQENWQAPLIAQQSFC